MQRRMAGTWARAMALAQAWWPDILIAACDPVNPTLVVLAVRTLRRLCWPPAADYGRASYDGDPMPSSSLTVTI